MNNDQRDHPNIWDQTLKKWMIRSKIENNLIKLVNREDKWFDCVYDRYVRFLIILDFEDKNILQI
jgi:hypothetical protein